ncbi:alpha/beta fold hydrolase [Legionella micdadei]|uniref:Pimeloyl-ACP methyl ester carboxylesterase n=1 Tax=Legionella micdadei TaxID=451 RepID=A0A098GGT1_LEGMI|nr:alpha/beta hydrolase [Legionella micdadei]ARG97328.1 alpha/beta hydrolase [Legionella micdadei]ARH00363.1 alpha/beta hydrolase [Legionella micdadei]KTD28213.1 hydrolase/acyltransferase [Legionella micdadei]NSL16842.1 alpha/beta hydrolase [Legionella micdadei]CEG61200.1 Predicted hydrolases or acyltransferases (Alpha/beta hydrolase superfamily) [Legionella micdadei]
MRELIHFAHGNGFPSPCYRQLLNGLQERYDCCFIDRIGHNPQFPVTENWHFLVDEVINSIKQQTNQPVIAVGHSLGGVLSLLGAIEQPSLFRAVIMLDSPLIGRFKSGMVRLAKALGIIDRVTPAARTRGRREYWQNRDQLIAYLRTRDLFKTFTEDCLQDYIDYGLEKTKDGYLLRFDRHIEYLIYRTIPHQLSEYEGKLSVPAVLIYGDKSSVVDRLDIRYMKKNYNISCYKIKGTHMFPMEYPAQVAKEILIRLDAILK